MAKALPIEDPFMAHLLRELPVKFRQRKRILFKGGQAWLIPVIPPSKATRRADD